MWNERRLNLLESDRERRRLDSDHRDATEEKLSADLAAASNRAVRMECLLREPEARR